MRSGCFFDIMIVDTETVEASRMKHCYECGAKLTEKHLEGEGMIPYCESCQRFRFPIFNTAVIMIVFNRTKDKILLIQQYGRDRYILVAGYVNKGESAENAVAREVMEEVGLKVIDYKFNKSEYYEKSNTLMLNFVCVAESEDLSHMTDEVDKARWFTIEEAKENIFHGSLAEKFLHAALDKGLYM